jgi:transcriptional regulator with AAA-type ATPase domain
MLLPAADAPLGFIAESRAMREAVDAARQFAPYNIPIYLEGPTGSGKEVLAKYIHEQSHRPGELVAVNLGALPKDLIASELFGHRRGSFTGAVQDHKGLVARAEKGTLFLDEIADLSPEAQLLLLRFVESKAYHVVGDTKESHADVRFVFATHKDLEILVRQGLFREDLYNRIAVARVDLPSLRERPEDILPLARFYLKAKAKEYAKPVPALSENAVTYLKAHAFSGNVRELAAMIARAVIVTPPGQAIEPEAFSHGRRLKGASMLEFPKISATVEKLLPLVSSSGEFYFPTFKSNELRQIAFIQAYARAMSQSPRGEPSMPQVGVIMQSHAKTPTRIFEQHNVKAWVAELRSPKERWQYSPELQSALAAKLPTLYPPKLINYSILYALNQSDAVLFDRRGHSDRISLGAWAESIGTQSTPLVAKLRDTNGLDVDEMIAERERNGSIDVEKWIHKINKNATSEAD